MLVSGCIPQVPETFDSPDPNQRLRAIVGSAEGGADTDVVPGLVDQLESTDPAARMLAIRALEVRTGQTLGYDHAADNWERARAVQAWRSWLREREAADPAQPELGADPADAVGNGI
ncbi:MAG: HEAT repeat domain-containing protein [Planctomycetota bacterium]